jgi:ribose transport system permease protein
MSTPLAYKSRFGDALGRGVDVLQRGSLLVAWIVLIVIFSALLPSTYPTTSNFASIFGSDAFVAVLALGLIVVLRTGEFDLSVAAVMTIGSDVLAVLNVNHGWAPLPAVIVTLLVGAGIGLVNGLLVTRCGVNSFIATLGVATILQGVALWITNEQTIVGVANVFVSLVVLDRFVGMSLDFFYALGLMLLLSYVFRYTSFGRRLLYVGKNANVARLSGINVRSLKVAAFVITGIISCAAGILLTGTSGSADPTSGLSYLLPVYAAAFLGAATTRSGEFTPVGTVVAVYFLVSGVTGLAIAGVSIYIQQIFYGGALIVAVIASHFFASRKKRSRPAPPNAPSSEAQLSAEESQSVEQTV